MSTLNRPSIEIELVFVLETALGGPSVNAVDVIRATDFILPAIEVVDDRYSRSGTAGVIDSIADAASCGFVMVGGNPCRLDQVDVRVSDEEEIAATRPGQGAIEERAHGPTEELDARLFEGRALHT